MLLLKYCAAGAGIGDVRRRPPNSYCRRLPCHRLQAGTPVTRRSIPRHPRRAWRPPSLWSCWPGRPADLGRDHHVPGGMAGVRVSQTKGTLAGTLYPGCPLRRTRWSRSPNVQPRDQLFTTGYGKMRSPKGRRREKPPRAAKEGLTLGLAITVRYEVDQAGSTTSGQPSPTTGKKKSCLRS